MMTNLFSLFDPSLSLFSLSWLIIIFSILFVPGSFWMSSLMSSFIASFLNFVKGEVDYIISSTKKGFYSFISSIFLMVFLYNFLALYPFVFSVTSHLLVTLPLSYSLWLGIIIFCWLKSLTHFLSHLVPSGTPLGLMSFMVLVESLSNLIRPIALTFRLTANMMAGHLLMSLVGGFLVSLPFTTMLFGSFLQMFLILMELGVSFIQAYVFFTLLLLYFSESEH